MIEKIIDTYFENIINESEQSGSKELKEIIKMVKQLPDEIAIEAGKLICYELLQNTDDRSGLIKSVK